MRLLLAALYPLRWCAARLARRHPLRLASVLVLKRLVRRLRYREVLAEIVPLDAPRLRFVCSDSMVEDAVFWFGMRGYEGVLYDVWLELVGAASSVLEIGGNIGFFTVAGAQANGAARYRVVEPNPAVAQVLRANLALNRLPQVEVIEAAAIDDAEPQMVVLNIPDEGRASAVGAHLLQGTEGIARSSVGTIECRGLPMRELLGDAGLVKIDAEGIEHALIEAVFDRLAADRPVLVLEVLPESSRLAALIRRLGSECGYLIYAVPGWGSDLLVRLRPEQFQASALARLNSKDVVLTPRPLRQPAREIA